MRIEEIRLLRLRQLVEEERRSGGNAASFAAKIPESSTGKPVAESYLSRMLSNKGSPGHKSIGEEMARRIEIAGRRPKYWLDTLEERPADRPAQRVWDMNVTQEEVHVGREWGKLHGPLRAQVQLMIETLVAGQIKQSRAKKPAGRKHQQGPSANPLRT